jgi:hypothetical protein
MVSTCQHCDKTCVLVARVNSQFYTMKVCRECAIIAARLVGQYPRDVIGELTVAPLEEEKTTCTDFFQSLSRN